MLLFSYRQYGIEEFDHRVLCNQALAVLGKDGGHPDAVVHRQADEPAKQKVVLVLFHQLTFRPNAIKICSSMARRSFFGAMLGAASDGHCIHA